MSDDPICEACGHPRSNHPYRHPFVGPSRDDTIKQQADRIEELEAKLARAALALAAWKHYDENGETDHVSLMLNYADAIEKTRTTLAELTGGKDAE